MSFPNDSNYCADRAPVVLNIAHPLVYPQRGLSLEYCISYVTNNHKAKGVATILYAGYATRCNELWFHVMLTAPQRMATAAVRSASIHSLLPTSRYLEDITKRLHHQRRYIITRWAEWPPATCYHERGFPYLGTSTRIFPPQVLL